MTSTDDLGPTSAPPFLATAALRQRLDLLGHLLEFGHQIVLVQGAPGSGRSRLLEALDAEYRANWRVIPCVGEAVANAPALLDALAAALEMADLNPGVEDLRARMAEIELGGQLCILTLDDAEQLDDAARALLFALAYSESQRGDLRVVMTSDADSGFGERFQGAAPEGAVIHVVDLPPMEIEELKTLALSALTADGGDAALDLSLDIDELAAAAKGNPGRLLASLRQPTLPPISPGKRSTAATQAMGGALGSALRNLNVRKYAAVLAAAAFVLVAVAVGVLLVGQHSRNSQPGTVEITLPPPGSAPPPAETLAESAPSPAGSPPETPAVTPPTVAAAETATAAPQVAPAAAPAAEPAAETAPATPSGEPPAPAPASTAEAATTVAAAATAATAASAETAPATTPVPAKPVTSKPVTGRTSSDKAGTGKAATGKPVAKPAAASPGSTTTSSAWLDRQKPGSYVVQLFGSRDRAAAQRFVRQQGLGAKANVVATTLKGAPWYVVVTGSYASRAAANDAIRAMSPTLQKQKPWPRTIATLK